MVSGKLEVDAEISIPWRHWTMEIESPAEKNIQLNRTPGLAPYCYRPTDHATRSLTTGRIYIYVHTAMRPKNRSTAEDTEKSTSLYF